MRKLAATLLLSVALAAAGAPPHADPALDKRAAALSEQLRCVVCQNQTIADSQAELAVDLRAEVRAMLARGMTDQQVLDFVVQRYGEFVLYRPPLRGATVLLWFAPLLLLGAGLAALWLRVRTGPRADGPAPASLAAATRLLDDKDPA